MIGWLIGNVIWIVGFIVITSCLLKSCGISAQLIIGKWNTTKKYGKNRRKTMEPASIALACFVTLWIIGVMS